MVRFGAERSLGKAWLRRRAFLTFSPFLSFPLSFAYLTASERPVWQEAGGCRAFRARKDMHAE